MSNILSVGRRAFATVFFAGADITDELAPYLLSVTYTDNEEDECDDLQIKLQDRDGIWLEKWLNSALRAAQKTSAAGTDYTVTATGGVAVRKNKGTRYEKIATLAYNTRTHVYSITGRWAEVKVTVDEKEQKGYVTMDALKPTESFRDDSAGFAYKGLSVQAVIGMRNAEEDGKDIALDCGQFELDSVVAAGPPSTVTLKATSLFYNTTVRGAKKSKSWETFNLNGIVSEIAKNNGMAHSFLSEVNPYYARVEQYNQTDIAFLQQLCRQAGAALKITNNIIVVFDEKIYNAKSVMKIKHDKSSGYLSYNLKTGKDNTYGFVTVTYTTDNGTKIEGTAYKDGYDAEKDDNVGLVYTQRVGSTGEAQRIAKELLRQHNKYEVTATFTFPGNPRLTAGRTVELSGWGAWDGTYIIKQAKHSIANSGYTTQITLRKKY